MRRDLGACFRAGRRSRLAGRYGRAERFLRVAVKLARSAGPADQGSLGWILNELGIVQKSAGRLDEAQASYVAALEWVDGVDPTPTAPQLRATLCHNLGGLEYVRRNFATADGWAEQGIRHRIEAVGSGHLQVAVDRAARAPILLELGRADEAETILNEVLATYLRFYGEMHHEVAVTLHNLATCAYRNGRTLIAIDLIRRATAIKRTVLGHSHPELAVSLANLGHLHEKLAEECDATKAYTEALAILSGRVHPDHSVLVACRNRLAALSSRQ